MTSQSIKNKPSPSAEYAGEVTAIQAWQQLLSNSNSMLIDVRTPEEWYSVGEPDISAAGKKLIKLPWKLAPDWRINPNFISQFERYDISRDTVIFFICRSGGRSLDAACEMTRQGWKHCFNVRDGFEGHGASNTLGWKASGLTWKLEKVAT